MMKAASSHAGWRIAGAVALAPLAASALAVLYFFDPETSGIYPVCLLHQTTGLLCPGCGTLRALHQLTHGNFAAAWGFNSFMVTMLPVGGWLLFREWLWLLTGRRPPGIVTRPVFGWIFLASVIAFGVLRNIHR